MLPSYHASIQVTCLSEEKQAICEFLQPISSMENATAHNAAKLYLLTVCNLVLLFVSRPRSPSLVWNEAPLSAERDWADYGRSPAAFEHGLESHPKVGPDAGGDGGYAGIRCRHRSDRRVRAVRGAAGDVRRSGGVRHHIHRRHPRQWNPGDYLSAASGHAEHSEHVSTTYHCSTNVSKLSSSAIWYAAHLTVSVLLIAMQILERVAEINSDLLALAAVKY